MTEFEKLMVTPWGDSLRLGIDKSIQNNITLSVFKEVTEDIFSESDFENEEWDEEDFWTMRFENWCTEIMRWVDTYPINKITLLWWAKDYVKELYNE